MKGPDLSYANGNINYEEMAKSVEFAILRAGYGKNNTDQYFVPHMEGCKKNNIPIGIYWFSYAYTQDMARKEAEYAVNHAKKAKDILFIAFDFEYDSANYYLKQTGKRVTKQLATDMAKAFCNKVQELGYKAVLYANKDYVLNYFDLKQIPADLWYAYYNKNSNRVDMGIWQYTSSGKLDGIKGNVDLNIMYKDYENKIPTGWLLDGEDKRWWYRHADNSYTKNDWEKIDGKWYFFDGSGYMVTGWINKDGSWYYLKPDGSMAESEILTIHSSHGAEQYAFGSDGHMLRSNGRGALM